MKKIKRIYLDNASITPLDPRVLSSMMLYLSKDFYNPSALYEEGRSARKAIESARRSIALILQSTSDEIFFTAGGTEANNIGILGVYEEAVKKSPKRKFHMITSTIEHPSILEVLRHLEAKGVDVTYLRPNEEGIIKAFDVIQALRKDTLLVSLMYGNNEIGTINNISKIGKEIKRIRESKKLPKVFIHTDASQGACYLNIRVDYLGVDLMTLDSSKLYGPRSGGVLYKKRGTPFAAISFGGSHEEGVRPGTENTSSIIGLAKALHLCHKEKKSEIKRLEKLREKAITVLRREMPSIIINGSMKDRLPNNINICFPGIDAEFMVIKLDLKGIAVSSATTCNNLMEDSSSYVITELDRYRKISCGRSSLRISLGRYTREVELSRAVNVIIKEVASQKSFLK